MVNIDGKVSIMNVEVSTINNLLSINSIEIHFMFNHCNLHHTFPSFETFLGNQYVCVLLANANRVTKWQHIS